MATESVTAERRTRLAPVLAALGIDPSTVHGQFVDPRFEKRYDAYLLVDDSGRRVLKADDGEHGVYERWLDGRDDLPVPRREASTVVDGRRWHVFAHAGDEDLQVLDRERAVAAGTALGRLHAAFWAEGAAPEEVHEWLAARRARFETVARAFPDLRPATDLVQRRAQAAPWTLCEGDLLPMNVLWDGHRATIIDFGVAGLRPYFGDPARFVVFGGPGATYEQPDGCREAFLGAYLREVRTRTGTTLTAADLARDVLLGELYERVCCLSSLLRRARTDAGDDALVPELDAARALAAQVVRSPRCDPRGVQDVMRSPLRHTARTGRARSDTLAE